MPLPRWWRDAREIRCWKEQADPSCLWRINTHGADHGPEVFALGICRVPLCRLSSRNVENRHSQHPEAFEMLFQAGGVCLSGVIVVRPDQNLAASERCPIGLFKRRVAAAHCRGRVDVLSDQCVRRLFSFDNDDFRRAGDVRQVVKGAGFWMGVLSGRHIPGAESLFLLPVLLPIVSLDLGDDVSVCVCVAVDNRWCAPGLTALGVLSLGRAARCVRGCAAVFPGILERVAEADAAACRFPEVEDIAALAGGEVMPEASLRPGQFDGQAFAFFAVDAADVELAALLVGKTTRVEITKDAFQLARQGVENLVAVIGLRSPLRG